MAEPLWGPPKVDKSGFLAAVWTSVVLALLFLPLRFYSRWITQKRLFADDWFVIAAWLLSLSISIVYTALVDQAFEVIYVGAGLVYPIPENFPTVTQQFYRSWTASFIVFYTSLWCIKLGFLLFFRRLVPEGMGGLRWHWWAVFAFTIATYFICIATLPYPCTFSSFEKMSSSVCTETKGLSFISAKVNCALDVFTDVLLVTIPVNILWRTSLTLRQRLALIGIFSLVIITIVFAIIRAIVTTSGMSNQMDPTWIELWTSLEMNVAIIVACVGSFRTLFTHDRRMKASKASRQSKPTRSSKPSRDDYYEVEDIILEGRAPSAHEDGFGRPSAVSSDSDLRHIDAYAHS